MTHPAFDVNGYPTEETLAAIREWPGEDLRGLFRFMREAWRYPEYWREERGTCCVSTGGWSGNESLVAALQENHVAWALCWHSSARGGHYVFKVDVTEGARAFLRHARPRRE